MGGSVTTSQGMCDRIQPLAMLLGTPGDPFSSWLIQRGVSTASVRLPRQMHNAEQLAAALPHNPHVSKVNHPSLPDYPQKELADRMFEKERPLRHAQFHRPGGYGRKIDAFMKALRFPRYAPRWAACTTLSHPVTSSHMGVPDDVRRKMGITPGMIRVSVGIEDVGDLIADFENALRVFDPFLYRRTLYSMAVINFLKLAGRHLMGTPFLIFCMVLGLYFMLRGGFFPLPPFRTHFKKYGIRKSNPKRQKRQWQDFSLPALLHRSGRRRWYKQHFRRSYFCCCRRPGAIFWMLVWHFPF